MCAAAHWRRPLSPPTVAAPRPPCCLSPAAGARAAVNVEIRARCNTADEDELQRALDDEDGERAGAAGSVEHGEDAWESEDEGDLQRALDDEDGGRAGSVKQEEDMYDSEGEGELRRTLAAEEVKQEWESEDESDLLRALEEEDEAEEDEVGDQGVNLPLQSKAEPMKAAARANPAAASAARAAAAAAALRAAAAALPAGGGRGHADQVDEDSDSGSPSDSDEDAVDRRHLAKLDLRQYSGSQLFARTATNPFHRFEMLFAREFVLLVLLVLSADRSQLGALPCIPQFAAAAGATVSH